MDKCQKLTQALLKGCEPMLWQTLQKKHLDPDNTITGSQWEDFIDDVGHIFANELSELGSELFTEWEENMKVD